MGRQRPALGQHTLAPDDGYPGGLPQGHFSSGRYGQGSASRLSKRSANCARAVINAVVYETDSDTPDSRTHHGLAQMIQAGFGGKRRLVTIFFERETKFDYLLYFTTESTYTLILNNIN